MFASALACKLTMETAAGESNSGMQNGENVDEARACLYLVESMEAAPAGACAARLPARSAAYADDMGCEFSPSHLIFQSNLIGTSCAVIRKNT